MHGYPISDIHKALMKTRFPKSLSAYLLITTSSVAFAQIGIPQAPEPKADQGPTMEQTIGWLKEKIDGYEEDWPSGYHVKWSFGVQNCNLSVGSSRTLKTVAGVTRETWTAPLWKLHPNSIQIETSGGALTLPSSGGEPPVIWIHKATGNFVGGGTYYEKTEQKYSIEIRNSDRELLERMRPAFKRLIELCSRQEADRKAALPPKPKELF